MYKINQRVITRKYGPGVIVNFEVLTAAGVELIPFYVEGARIGVQLDTPENWPLHGRGLPYFTPGDLI